MTETRTARYEFRPIQKTETGMPASVLKTSSKSIQGSKGRYLLAFYYSVVFHRIGEYFSLDLCYLSEQNLCFKS